MLRGVPSLMAGIPGTGKSYLDLARRILMGTEYPDGQAVRARGPVLYVDAENTPAIHKTRLAVWPESLLHDLYRMLPAPDRFVIDLDDTADRDRLSNMAWLIEPVLIIVDSYGSCTLKGENNKEDVQGLLAYLNRLAQEFNCGLLVIHHLRKGVNTDQASFTPMTVDAIRGSSHIAAMARNIWGLQFVATGPQPGPNDPRRLWIMKTNVGASPDPLGVRFSPHPDDAQVARLSYGDAPEPYKEASRVDECADWILTLLEDAREPIKPAHLIEQAKAEGYAPSLIYRARKRLVGRVVDTEQSCRHPKNSWALAERLENGVEPPVH